MVWGGLHCLPCELGWEKPSRARCRMRQPPAIKTRSGRRAGAGGHDAHMLHPLPPTSLVIPRLVYVIAARTPARSNYIGCSRRDSNMVTRIQTRPNKPAGHRRTSAEAPASTHHLSKKGIPRTEPKPKDWPAKPDHCSNLSGELLAQGAARPWAFGGQASRADQSLGLGATTAEGRPSPTSRATGHWRTSTAELLGSHLATLVEARQAAN